MTLFNGKLIMRLSQMNYRRSMAVIIILSAVGIVSVIGSRHTDNGHAETLVSVTAKQADALVDTIGVNIHIHYDDTVYGTRWNEYVKPLLINSGIRHIRDGAVTYAPANYDTFYYQRLRELGAAGIKASLIAGSGTDYTKLDDIIGWTNGMVDQFEGTNEPDLQNSPDFIAQTRTSQQQLWNTAKSNPLTASIRIAGPSTAYGSEVLRIGDLSPWMDVNNGHPYPVGNMPIHNLDSAILDFSKAAPGKPFTATETGYNNALNAPANEGHSPTSEAASGTYYPRLAFEYFNRGVKSFYGYEFIDMWPDSGKVDRESNFGLVRNDGTVKPAYTVIKNLITLLKDPGDSFVPKSMQYALTGGDANTHTTLLQKRDGRFYLAIWQEVRVWDQAARTALAPADLPMTLSIGGTATSINLYKPNQGLGALKSATNATTFAFNSSSQLSLIEITGIAAGTPTPAPAPVPAPTPTPAPAPLADVIVTSIASTPANPVTGTPMTFTAVVKNQGTAATPVGTTLGVGFTVNGAAVAWSDSYSAALAAGASVTLTANNGPGGKATWLAISGSHSVSAHVDDINRFAESNEANNVLTTTLVVAAGIRGDVTGDGRVNALDISVLLSRDGQNYPAADFNADGTVGAADLAVMLGNWTW